MAITNLQRLPLNMPDFIALRESGMIYVDKTRKIASIAMLRQQFFLARPRRFGKSLLISTFEALFSEGLKYFDGLAIHNIWREERCYNVVRLDFSTIRLFDSIETFTQQFERLLSDAFGKYGFKPQQGEDRLIHLEIDNWLKTQPRQSLVLLIDEYDAPLTAVLDNQELFKAVRERLASFYSVCKTNVAQLRFFFMTGIAKFNQTGIYSELNNLVDISLDPMSGDIVGYTESEIKKYFSPYLKDAAATLGLSEDETLQKLRQYYDGYCFDENASVHVYSPWSVLNFFARPYRGFKNYWIESGGQLSLLGRYLKDHALRNPADYALEIPTGPEKLRDTALLTLAGYLTIKRRELDTFFLGYPNREVEEAMATFYSERLLEGRSIPEVGAGEIRDAFEKGRVDEAVTLLNRIFLNIHYAPQPVRDEATCRNYAQLMLVVAGLRVSVERSNIMGRSDLEVCAGRYHWVLELKFLPRTEEEKGRKPERLLEDALAQLREKRYGLQDGGEEKRIRAALVFSEQRREFVLWQECLEADA